jgi:hypothetical protein
MSPLVRIRQAAACSVFVLTLCGAIGGTTARADVAAERPSRATAVSSDSAAMASNAAGAPASTTAVPSSSNAVEPAKPVQLAPNIAAQIAHSALLTLEATAKPDVLQISIRRVSDRSFINTDDITIAVDGKNQSVTREKGTVYELPINDLRGDGARDVDVTVAHDGIREIVSGKVTVTEAPTSSLWRDHKQVAWWVLNIAIILVAAWTFSGRKSKNEDE